MLQLGVVFRTEVTIVRVASTTGVAIFYEECRVYTAGRCLYRPPRRFIFVATYVFRDRKAVRSGPYRDSTLALAQV